MTLTNETPHPASRCSGGGGDHDKLLHLSTLGCALLCNYSVITEVMVFLGQKYMLRFFYSAVAGGPEFTVRV
jgi:hypothetical protein